MVANGRIVWRRPRHSPRSQGSRPLARINRGRANGGNPAFNACDVQDVFMAPLIEISGRLMKRLERQCVFMRHLRCISRANGGRSSAKDAARRNAGSAVLIPSRRARHQHGFTPFIYASALVHNAIILSAGSWWCHRVRALHNVIRLRPYVFSRS